MSYLWVEFSRGSRLYTVREEGGKLFIHQGWTSGSRGPQTLPVLRELTLESAEAEITTKPRGLVWRALGALRRVKAEPETVLFLEET